MYEKLNCNSLLFILQVLPPFQRYPDVVKQFQVLQPLKVVCKIHLKLDFIYKLGLNLQHRWCSAVLLVLKICF